MINEVVLVSGMFCVTYFIRYIPLGISNNFKLPFYFEKGLKYVPTAVLMAITSLAIFTQDDGNLNFNLTNPYIYGALGSFISGFVFQKLLVTKGPYVILNLNLKKLLSCPFLIARET